MRHVVSRGHEDESRRSSGRGEYIREDTTRYFGSYSAAAGQTTYHQQASYGSSAGEDVNAYEGESPQDYIEYSQGQGVDPNVYYRQR
jgi:hypothetical protein